MSNISETPDAFDAFSNNNKIHDKLKACRQDNGISIEEVVNHTQIGATFITYLERGDFEKLPATVYSLGMVENMLEYYRVDSHQKETLLVEFEKALLPFEEGKGNHIPYFLEKTKENAARRGGKTSTQKKNSKESLTASDESLAKLQETPAQKEDSFAEKGGAGAGENKSTTKYRSNHSQKRQQNNNNRLLIILIPLFFISVVALLFYFIYQYNLTGIDKVKTGELQLLEKEDRNTSYTLFDRFDTFELSEGDRVRLFFGEALKVFEVERITARDLTFTVDNYRSYILRLREEVSLDFDEDLNSDFSIKFQRVSDNVGVVYFESSTFNDYAPDYAKVWEEGEKLQVTSNYTLLKNNNKSLIRIFIKATTLPVYLSYNIDGKRQNTFSLTPGSDTLITAENHIELQVGNYRTAAVVVNSYPLRLGLAGNSKYSTTKIIKWLKSAYNETQYDLVIQDYVN